MLDKIKHSMEFSAKALEMRSRRQDVVSSNIANVDTPGYKAVDVDFGEALSEATGIARPAASGFSTPRLQMTASTEGMIRTNAAHIEGKLTDNGAFSRNMKFRRGDTAALDGNSVNIERERAVFAENSIKYEATLKSIDGRIRTLKSAMKSGF